MSSDDPFLAAAESIGQRIVAEAVWQGGVCSWMGAVMDRKLRRSEYRALEADLLGGTAGVGLFLAQLAAVTGDQVVRRTALGAIRHALVRSTATGLGSREGFHAGSLGIAWAAARAAELLDDDELRRIASTVRVPATGPSDADPCPDVITGSAGSILALLALADALDQPALSEQALLVGEDLISRARVTRHGWSWAIPGRIYRHHLCGLSHGAAGIGWALLELFAASGDERFRAGAIGAFDYERSWLDMRSGTWPDLRIGGRRRGARQRVASSTVGTWCHGEGGIALTRLRAAEVLGPESSRQDGEIALDTTRRELAASLPYEIEDLTLCHGAAGSADVLLCGAAALPERWRALAGVAVELGGVALDRHRDTSGDWPCGAAGGTTPGLFRGLSGIGWWFLRLHDPSTPSPLAMPILRLTAVPARA